MGGKRTSQGKNGGKQRFDGRVVPGDGSRPRRRADARRRITLAKALCCASSVRQPHIRRRCSPPLEGSCSPAIAAPSMEMASSRWWAVLYPSPRATTAGGRALERRQGVRRQRRRRHRSLPARALPMPHARERLARMPSHTLTCIVRFDSCMSRLPAHIAEKLLATRVRWTGCEGARA